jgi:hypothetical protein
MEVEGNMSLSVKSLAVASGALWGGCMLTCGLVSLAAPQYARGFLGLMSSVYPGFRNSRTVPDVLVGTGYGLVDGAAAGLLFGALYNHFASRDAKPKTRIAA